MATLVLTGLGTLIGGPLGGAIGALAGQQIDQAIIGSRTQRGPRLKELAVQASSYGTPIPRVYGRMRVAGSVIWATDLKEHRKKQGGGKGKPKTVTYSYSSSFAVAISSRPIQGIGRIWADGNLLRGSNGDLKTPAWLRIHHGHGDQGPDPLLAAAEDEHGCPAFRGLAYVVFEDLQLADFGNRIPSLSFEVIADEGPLALASVVADLLPEAEVAALPGSLTGFAVDGGSVAEALQVIAGAVPLRCTSSRDGLAVGPAEPKIATVATLPQPVATGTGAEAERRSGFDRWREPLSHQRRTALRYYDVTRDYQPGVQHGRGRALPGDAATLEFPAAMDAGDARELADEISRRTSYPQDRATYRIAELDPALSPGALARVPGSPERWRVEEWEWSAEGVELSLRALPHSAGSFAAEASDPGRASVAPDLALAATQIAAMELPWDGNGAGNSPALFLAASAASAGWRGAALYLVQPDQSLLPLGATGRDRAVIGVAAGALGPASPLLLDRRQTVEVVLAGPDLQLADASLAQLAMGANRALLGEEIVQFGSAEPLGQGRWRLGDLLRGRGGTEGAVTRHAAGEPFVLLDDALLPLDPELVGDAAHARITAQGLIDAEPVIAGFLLPGATLRPLSPVHGTATITADGSIALSWTRRARGAWKWEDGVDVPLSEEAENYVVTLGPVDAPAKSWDTREPRLNLPAETVAGLRAISSGDSFTVRQIGTHSVSRPLTLGIFT